MKFSLVNLVFALKQVYFAWIYWAITAVVAVIVFSINVLSTNFRLLITNFNFKLISYLITGVTKSMSLISLIMLPIISILVGVIASMFLFKLQSSQKLSTGGYGLGSSGALLGALVPSCSACGFGLLSILGYSSLLVFLPFKGLELGVIGIGLLVLGIFSLSDKIAEGCKLNF